MADEPNDLEDAPAQCFDLLPREVVDLWLEGKYAGGLQRSLAYDRLGWALMLRGFYRYHATSQDQNARDEIESAAASANDAAAPHNPHGGDAHTHRGYCVFDVQDGELRCYGIRVMTGAGWQHLAGREHPLLWKSDVCAIRTLPSSAEARLTCVYRLLIGDAWAAMNDKEWPGSDADFDAYRKEREEFAGLWSEGTSGNRRMSHGGVNELQEAKLAVGYLARSYERDWRNVRAYVARKLEALQGTPVKDLQVDSSDHLSPGGSFEFLPTKDLQRFVAQELAKSEACLVARFEDREKVFDQLTKAILQDALPATLPELLKKCHKKAKTADLQSANGKKLLDQYFEQLITEDVRQRVQALRNATQRVIFGGFRGTIRRTGKYAPLTLTGDYGAFGRTSVGGTITFERLDAFSR